MSIPGLLPSVGGSAGVTPPAWEGDEATPRTAPQRGESPPSVGGRCKQLLAAPFPAWKTDLEALEEAAGMEDRGPSSAALGLADLSQVANQDLWYKSVNFGAKKDLKALEEAARMEGRGARRVQLLLLFHLLACRSNTR